MESLPSTNPEVFHLFSEFGDFVVSRTGNPFSAIGVDHRHKQLNKDVKGNGGMVGLTEKSVDGVLVVPKNPELWGNSKCNTFQCNA